MRALTSETGATRATVAHYLALGILPEPVRTGRNMAYYDPECINIIELVRELQTRRHLPLGVIADMIQQQGYVKLRALLDATRAGQHDIVGLLRGSEPVARDELLGVEGISELVLEDLEAIGLVVRLEEELYDPLSRQIVEAVGIMRRAGLDERSGFRVVDLQSYRDALSKLVEQEMALFNNHVLGRVPAEEAERIVRDSLSAAEALILGIRKRLLVKLVESELV